MATFSKRGEYQWQAKIRRQGYPPQSRTFETRDAAEKWARMVEREMDTTGFVDRREAEKTTLRSLLDRYKREVTPTKKPTTVAVETQKIDLILRDSQLVNLKLSALNSTAIAEWRDRRLALVSGGTVNREIDILSAAINHARREWGIHIENPIELVKRPPKARARDRRLTKEEEQYLFSALESAPRRPDGTYEKAAKNPWLAPVVKLALETAMRRGELLSLLWENVDLKRRTAHLPETKNGEARTVPLSTKAVKIFRSLPKATEGRVFPISPMALRKGFTRAIERARGKYREDCEEKGVRPDPSFLADIRFHDTRHEAASRLADKLSNVLELSAVTGHKDLRMLKRYYHPRAEDLAKKLG